MAMIPDMATTIQFKSPSGHPASLGRNHQGQLHVSVEGAPHEQEALTNLAREYGCDNLREAYRMLKTYGGAR